MNSSVLLDLPAAENAMALAVAGDHCRLIATSLLVADDRPTVTAAPPTSAETDCLTVHLLDLTLPGGRQLLSNVSFTARPAALIALGAVLAGCIRWRIRLGAASQTTELTAWYVVWIRLCRAIPMWRWSPAALPNGQPALVGSAGA